MAELLSESQPSLNEQQQAPAIQPAPVQQLPEPIPI